MARRTRRVIPHRPDGRAKPIPVVKSQIKRPLTEDEIEAALASDEVKGPVARWARLFGLWSAALTLAIALPVVAAAQATAPSATVTVREHALIDNELVVLGDLAEIEASDHQTHLRLRGLYLGPAPRHGQSQRLSREQIESRLAQDGWDTSEIALHLPSTVIVEREARLVGEEELRSLAEDFLIDALPHDPERVVIEAVRVPRELVLPPGEYAWDLQVTGARRTAGSVTFDLRALQNQIVVGRVSGSARVDLKTTLVETTQDVDAGTVLTADHVREIQGMESQAPRGAFTAVDQALGLETTTSLRAGTVLTQGAAVPPTLVRRGDIVTIVYESNGLRVTDKAVSTRDGAAGDEIIVQNLDGQRPVRALVTGPRTVRALF